MPALRIIALNMEIARLNPKITPTTANVTTAL